MTCPCYDRTSFAAEYGNGNVIPANRIDPVAKATQAYFPGSNTAGTLGTNGILQNNYTYTSPSSNPFIKWFGRLDYDITGNNRLTISDTEGDNPGESFGAGICPIGCQSNDVSRNNAQVTDVWTPGPNITNELRMGYTNQLNFFVPATLNQGFPAKSGWQFATLDNFPNINFNNYANILNSSINAVYKEHSYDPSDVVGLILGKHVLTLRWRVPDLPKITSTAWGNLNVGTMGYTGVYTSEYPGSSSTGF